MPASEAADHQFGSKRACSRAGLEAAGRLVGCLGEVARRCHPKPFRVTYDERARRVRSGKPLLPGDREEVEPGDVDWYRAHRLCTVDEDREPRVCAELSHGKDASGRPDHLRERKKPRSRSDSRSDRVRIGSDDDDPCAGRVQGPEEAEVLVGRGHDLVVRGEPESRQHDVAPVRRAGGECHLEGVGRDDGREPSA